MGGKNGLGLLAASGVSRLRNCLTCFSGVSGSGASALSGVLVVEGETRERLMGLRDGVVKGLNCTSAVPLLRGVFGILPSAGPPESSDPERPLTGDTGEAGECRLCDGLAGTCCCCRSGAADARELAEPPLLGEELGREVCASSPSSSGLGA